jgi:quercetin dioxygenase-like cupin family protein
MATSVFHPETAEPVSLASLATPSAAGITSRTLLKTTGGKAVLFAFDAGQELTEHTNPNHALIQVLTGSLVVTLAGRPETLKPGQLLHMPPQLPHAVRAEEPATFLLTLLAP